MEHGEENNNCRFGIREVDKSKGNVISFKQGDVDENYGGSLHGVNYCDCYIMTIVSSITQLHRRVDI